MAADSSAALLSRTGGLGNEIAAERFDTGSQIVWRYFVGDHLGSTTTLTDTVSPTPNPVERDSGACPPARLRDRGNAWGKRRNADATDDPACSITSLTTRGYTGHEMLDDFCLINMNGRIYDPGLGHFLSADDRVPDPFDGRSYNRYSYLNNNPLNGTDPSGHNDIIDDITTIMKAVLACIDGCGADETVVVTGTYDPPEDPNAGGLYRDAGFGGFGGGGGLGSGESAGGGDNGKGRNSNQKPKTQCKRGSATGAALATASGVGLGGLAGPAAGKEFIRQMTQLMRDYGANEAEIATAEGAFEGAVDTSEFGLLAIGGAVVGGTAGLLAYEAYANWDQGNQPSSNASQQNQNPAQPNSSQQNSSSQQNGHSEGC